MGVENQYLGNPNLKKAFVSQEFTKENILEFQKCMNDPQYFIEKYIKIVSLDKGLIPFDMYPFQKEMVGTFHNNRFSICKLPRQSGKTTTIISYILHYVLFNESVMLQYWQTKLQLQEIYYQDYNLHMKIYLNGYNKVLSTGTKVV